MLARYPFLVGLVVSAFLMVLLHFIPGGVGTLRLARGVGLVIYGAVLLLLFRQGMDRDEVPYFFFGGVLGLLAGFFMVL